MDEIIGLITKSYGLVGLLVISPVVALKFLWADNQKLRADLQAANDKVAAIAEKRVDDVKAIAEKLMSMATEQSQLSQETNTALERVGDALTVVANSGSSRVVIPRRKSVEEGP